MTIKYFGKNIEEGRRNPEAQIWYDEDNKIEEEKVNKIDEILKDMGWEYFAEYGVTIIPLLNGRYDYSQLILDYKKAKNIVRGMRNV